MIDQASTPMTGLLSQPGPIHNAYVANANILLTR
jgi:hypothetical protein